MTLQQFEWLNTHLMDEMGCFLVIPVTDNQGMCLHAVLPPKEMDYLENVYNSMINFNGE